jgi:hypothetical protein
MHCTTFLELKKMDKQLNQLITKTAIPHEFFPLDFFYTDVIPDNNELLKSAAEIYVERYNQKFIHCKNSHRPISKILLEQLIIRP